MELILELSRVLLKCCSGPLKYSGRWTLIHFPVKKCHKFTTSRVYVYFHCDIKGNETLSDLKTNYQRATWKIVWKHGLYLYVCCNGKKTPLQNIKKQKTLQNKTHLCNCCFLCQAFEVAEIFTAPPSLSFMDNTLTHGPRREWWCWCSFLCSWCNRMSQTVTLRFNFMPNV